ncbi:unnamed protein product [Durusdinium trenchii]|uniref:DUS-like FMN-binding domain-containing protein n=1 Tax=Durusdinium trenchii TaxID=1381693 RepID=A0ABP0T0W6_9DINO
MQPSLIEPRDLPPCHVSSGTFGSTRTIALRHAFSVSAGLRVSSSGGCFFPSRCSAGEEHPVVLQLGGSDPETLAHAVRLASPWSYDEINLNCGCPSEAAVKTRQGHGFGAQLMTCPELVRACTEAMQEAASVGVSVKCRIWTHPTLADLERDGDRFETLLRFVDTVSAGGVRRFIVHARSGILAGLKASENRKRPPLHHDFVEELQRERPELELTLNGGICSLEEIEETRAKGLEVMVGRWAVQQPWAFADESARARGRGAILQDYLAYARRELQEHREDHLSILADPLRNLFAGVKKSGEYRRVLSEALSSSPREGGWDRFQTAFATALSHLPESAFEGEK